MESPSEDSLAGSLLKLFSMNRVKLYFLSPRSVALHCMFLTSILTLFSEVILSAISTNLSVHFPDVYVTWVLQYIQFSGFRASAVKNTMALAGFSETPLFLYTFGYCPCL